MGGQSDLPYSFPCFFTFVSFSQNAGRSPSRAFLRGTVFYSGAISLVLVSFHPKVLAAGGTFPICLLPGLLTFLKKYIATMWLWYFEMNMCYKYLTATRFFISPCCVCASSIRIGVGYLSYCRAPRTSHPEPHPLNLRPYFSNSNWSMTRYPYHYSRIPHNFSFSLFTNP